MNRQRTLLISLAVCAGVACLAGPAGRLLVVLPLLLFGPGFLIQRALWPDAPRDLMLRPTLWIGLSASSIALLYLWVTTLGLALPSAALFMLALACTLGVGWSLWRADEPATQPAAQRRAWLAPGLLLIVFVLTLWTRFAQIDGLPLPPWVDSVHHALLIRVAAERGQAPLSLQPYLPVEQLPYHWGYHVFSASVWQLSGVTLPQLMLWEGQILGALQVLTCAGLAAFLWRRPLAGVVAGLVVGLVSIMPAYYLSWGRYTLLLGMLMLPATMIAVVRTVRAPGWRSMLLCAILLTGLSLVHFIVFVFALLWCAAALLVDGLPSRRVWPALVSLVSAGITVAAATAPWLLLLAGRARPGTGIAATHVAGNDVYNAMPEGLLWASNNRLLIALAAAAAGLGLWRRLPAAAALVLWGLLSILAANPVWFGLPYLSFVTNEMVAITLFLPIAVLIGGGAALLDDTVRNGQSLRAERVWLALRSAGLAALAAACAYNFQAVVRTDTVLGQPDDLAAIAWVSEHTPPDARFVVNTARWLGNVDRGADGGWWLLPLAARQVSTPPVVYTYGPDAFVRETKHQSGWLRAETQHTPDDIAAFMRRYGYSYAYATSNGAQLKTEDLLRSGLFDELYHRGDVSVLKLRVRG